MPFVTGHRAAGGPAAVIFDRDAQQPGRKTRRTDAAAPAACLAALVSDSWITRYAVRSTASGSGLTGPVTSQLTRSPAR